MINLPRKREIYLVFSRGKFDTPVTINIAQNQPTTLLTRRIVKLTVANDREQSDTTANNLVKGPLGNFTLRNVWHLNY